jgi:putative tryptophan/tyrosine transport system substrate-binding protein
MSDMGRPNIVAVQRDFRKPFRPSQIPAVITPQWGAEARGQTMRRRKFITILGGAATWPMMVRAQAAPSVIGFLHEGLPAPLPLTSAFRQGLLEAGVSEGSVTIENRWAEGHYDRLPALAADLIEQRAPIIVAAYLVAALAAKAATQTIPIVFVTGSDPVAAGLVSSLARPTSNLTGIAFMFTRLGPKNLATLHELLPFARVIGALVNSNNPNAEPQIRDLQVAAPALGLQVIILRAGSARDVDSIFSNLEAQKIEALFVTADGFFFGLQDQIVSLAARYKVPTVYPLNDYVVAGGLISYGASRADSFRQAGIYVGRILKGAHPSDLPVLQSAKFQLVINLKTAKALGLSIPATLLATADEVIE